MYDPLSYDTLTVSATPKQVNLLDQVLFQFFQFLCFLPPFSLFYQRTCCAAWTWITRFFTTAF